MSKLLASYLAFWARRFLSRTGVRIVAVTGNVGKTTTKEAIGAVLSRRLPVRVVRGNFNVSFGVPMGILGGGWDDRYYETGGGPLFWLCASLAAPVLALFRRPREQVVVVEYGADRPGDVAWLTRRFPPHVSVVTAVGDIPVHVEYFVSPLHLAAEKATILNWLSPGDYAVLNADDLTVLEMRKRVRGTTVTFGMGGGADVRADGLEILSESGRPEGVTFALHNEGQSVPVRIWGALGRSQAMAAAAAVAVGRAFGASLEDSVSGLVEYRPPAGRMRIVRGIKETTVLDDSYNSSPSAVHNALDMLKAVPGTRRIAVLGDMLELGGRTIVAHQAAGDMAGSIANVLVCVGDRSKFTADSAGNQLLSEDIHWFRTSREAALKVQELLRPGDVVLVKGSQGMRMERVVKEIMDEPVRAPHLLVRQGRRWLQKA